VVNNVGNGYNFSFKFTQQLSPTEEAVIITMTRETANNSSKNLHRFFTLLVFHWLFFASGKPVARLCTDTSPVDILATSLTSTWKKARGVEVVTIDDRRGYRFDLKDRLLSMDANSLMKNCQFFPSEFSLTITFWKKEYRNENEYLLTLLAPDRRSILIAVRIQRSTLYFDFVSTNHSSNTTNRNLNSYSFKPDKKLKMTSSIVGGKWHTVIIVVAGNYVSFTLDCLQYNAIHSNVKGKSNSTGFPPNLPVYPFSRFHIASKRSRRNRFTGVLSEVLLTPGADISTNRCMKNSLFDNLYQYAFKAQPENFHNHYIKYAVNNEMSLQNEEPLTCKIDNRGQLIYREDEGDVEICDQQQWKKIATTNRKLDYISEYSDLTTRSKSHDAEVFKIAGHGQFVAFANQGRDNSMDSTIFKWAGNKFEVFQNFTTENARKWEFFTIGTEQFLAVAIQGLKEVNAEAQSKIYRWKEEDKKFVKHQLLTTFAAKCFKSFKIDGRTYLAVANYRKKNSHQAISWVYRWEDDERAFIKYQSIQTVGAYDIEFFKLSSNEYYLAIANSYNGVTTKLDSVLYKWDSSLFVPIQYIPTTGATDIEYFKVEGVNFIAIANYYDHEVKSNKVTSTVYRYRKQKKLFEKFQEIPTFGALDFEFFNIGKESYLLAANSGDGNNNLFSNLYRWKGVEGFVSVHKVPTNPCSDFELFTINNNQHYLVSASSENQHSRLFQIMTF